MNAEQAEKRMNEIVISRLQHIIDGLKNGNVRLIDVAQDLADESVIVSGTKELARRNISLKFYELTGFTKS